MCRIVNSVDTKRCRCPRVSWFDGPVLGGAGSNRDLILGNLRDPFLSDDYVLVSRASMRAGDVAWYLVTPGGDGAFRPAGYLYFALVKQWAGLEPSKWHFAGLVLHPVNCALVYQLAMVLWSDPAIALGSELLFGVQAAHPEVVTWAAGSFDSVACCFSLAALLCAFGSGSARYPWLSPALTSVFLALAISSKASAYAAPIALASLGWARGDLRRAGVKRSLIGALLVCVALLLYRWQLFHGPGGHLNPATGRPAILSLSLAGSSKATLVRLWAILLFPIDWQAGGRLGLAVATGGLPLRTCTLPATPAMPGGASAWRSWRRRPGSCCRLFTSP